MILSASSLLEHQDHRSDRPSVLDQTKEDRGGDIIRDISDDLDQTARTGRGKIISQHIPGNDLHPVIPGKTVLQNTDQTRIDFESDHTTGLLCQFGSQYSQTCTDFHYSLVSCRCNQSSDPTDDVHILEKRLTQPLARTDVILSKGLSYGVHERLFARPATISRCEIK